MLYLYWIMIPANDFGRQWEDIREDASAASSGARTTTCLTASCPRSIDCATSAVPIVAAAEPMATPTMVPLTPKADAISAARTAPATEARIWRNENFTGD